MRRVLAAIRETSIRGAWAPIAVFAAHVVFAFGIDLYAKWIPLDDVMHFTGGVVIAYFWARALDAFERQELIDRTTGWFRGLVVVTLSTTSTGKQHAYVSTPSSNSTSRE